MYIDEQTTKNLWNKTKLEILMTDPLPILNSLGLEYKQKNQTQYFFSVRGERTASANLYITKGGVWKYFDFGSGNGGSVVDLVMEATNKQYKEAQLYCIDILGTRDYFKEEMELKGNYKEQTSSALNEKDLEKLEAIRTANIQRAKQNNVTSKMLSKTLITNENQEAIRYLNSRGITKIPNFLYEIKGEIFKVSDETKKKIFSFTNMGIGVINSDGDSADIHYYKPIKLKSGKELKTATFGNNHITSFINGDGKKLIIAESKWDMASAYEQELLNNATCIIANSTSNIKLIEDYIKDKNFTFTLILNQNDKAGEKFKDELLENEFLNTIKSYCITYKEGEEKEDINDLLKKGIEIKSRIIEAKKNLDNSLEEMRKEVYKDLEKVEQTNKTNKIIRNK